MNVENKLGFPKMLQYTVCTVKHPDHADFGDFDLAYIGDFGDPTAASTLGLNYEGHFKAHFPCLDFLSSIHCSFLFGCTSNLGSEVCQPMSLDSQCCLSTDRRN